MTAVEVTRRALTAAELRAEAGRTKDAQAARRMLALAMVLTGADRTSAAKTCGMDRQTLRDWVHRYNAERGWRTGGPGAAAAARARADCDARSLGRGWPPIRSWRGVESIRDRVARKAGAHLIEGRAWSGWGEVTRVEVTIDGGTTWQGAKLEAVVGRFAWRRWTFPWTAEPGLHVISTDATGRTQPAEPPWNRGSFANTSPQRVEVLAVDA